METASLIASILSIIFSLLIGVLAVYLAFKFNEVSTKLILKISEMTNASLGRIEKSTHATEITTTELIEPFIKMMSDQITNMFTAFYTTSSASQVDSASQISLSRMQSLVDQMLSDQEEELKDRFRQALKDEYEDFSGKLKFSFARVGEEIEKKISAEDMEDSSPWSLSYNWAPFIKKINDMKKTHNFLSVKYLYEKRFKNDPRTRDELTAAIDRTILSTRHINNPHDPEHPTLICELNIEHPEVIELLKVIMKDETPS